VHGALASDQDKQVIGVGARSGAAPISDSPDGFDVETEWLHRSSLRSRVWPFTVAVLLARSATMAAADFCRSRRALPRGALPERGGRVRWSPQGFRPGPQSGSHSPFRRLPTDLPNKDMDYQCTTAAFTLSPAPGGFRHLGLTHPGTEPSMRITRPIPGARPSGQPSAVQNRSLAILSVRRLAPLRSGFLQTAPRGAALPSASSYVCPDSGHQGILQGTSTPSVHAHVGRTPSLRGTAGKRCLPVPSSASPPSGPSKA